MLTAAIEYLNVLLEYMCGMIEQAGCAHDSTGCETVNQYDLLRLQLDCTVICVFYNSAGA